jgi:hypothetical protein
MEFFVSFLLYLGGAASVGLVVAWAARQVSSGASMTWRSDGWPHGVQEDEPSSDWGARFRTPAALARRAAEAVAGGVIEELSGQEPPDVPIQRVRR